MHYYNPIHSVFDKKYGLGLVVTQNYSKVWTAAFFGDGELHELGSGYIDLDNITGKNADDEILSYFFRQNSIRQGAELAQAGCVSVKYGNNKYLSCVVKDNRISYSLDLNGNYRYTDSNCSCRRFKCAHQVAVIKHVEMQMSELKEKYVKSSLDIPREYFVTDKLRYMLEINGDFTGLSKDNIALIRDIVDEMLISPSDSYFSAVFDAIFSLRSRYYEARFLESRANLFYAMMENDRIRESFIENRIDFGADYEERQEKSNRITFSKLCDSYIRQRNNNFSDKSKDSLALREFHCKYTCDPTALFELFADDDYTFGEGDCGFILDACDNPISKESEKYIPVIIEKLDSYPATGDFVKATDRLISTLGKEEYTALLPKLKNHKISLDAFRGLEKDIQKELVFSLRPGENEAVYVLTGLLEGSDDQTTAGRYIAGILAYFATIEIKISKNLADIITARVRTLPHNKLLLSLLDAASGKKAKVDVLPEREDISAYFTCTYEAIERENDCLILYGIKASPYFICAFEEKSGNINPIKKSFIINISPKAGETVKEIAVSADPGKFRNEVSVIEDNILSRQFSKNFPVFSRDFDILCYGLNKQAIIFNKDNKVNITYIFNTHENALTLSLKVGNVKSYVVKNAYEFLGNFNSRRTVKYGKDLVLTHSLENLEDRDVPVIRTLINSDCTPGTPGDSRNTRFITLTGDTCNNILELLEGRTVLIDDKPCLISSEGVKLGIKVDEYYVPELITPGDFTDLFYCGEKAYIITESGNSRELLKVAAAPDEIKVYDFVYKHPSVSIKPIIGSFVKNIYSRFSDIFEINENIKKDFKLSEIKISAYFDFEGSVISVKTIIRKDDKEISPDKLTEKADFNKYTAYMRYLISMGFENGIIDSDEKILSFLKMDFSSLRKLCKVYLSENLSSKTLVQMKRQVITISCSKGRIVEAVLEKSEFSKEELEQIIKGIRKKKKFIYLGTDRIVDLTGSEARNLEETVTDLGLDEKNLYQKRKITMVNAIKAFAHENSCRVDRYLRDMIEEIRSFKDSDIMLPPMKEELRGYQQEGYRWMSILSKYNMGGILADDMGLGKTFQVITVIKASKEKKPSLIICPKSLVFNWVREFDKFDGETEITEIFGPAQEREKAISSIDYGKKAVYITSYDSLRNDISLYSGEFSFCILDEAQYIKNVNARKSRSVKELKALHRFALTGTPIENNVIDLWSIFDFILPGYFEELSEFRSNYTGDENYADVIAKKTGPFVLRRVKGDVLSELPEKYERILTAEMGETQRKVYDSVKYDASRMLKNGGKAFDILPYLMRLRQICVDPAMFIDNYEGSSGKMDLLKDLIPEYISDGHRMLIFSQFVKGLNQVEELLKKCSIPYFILTGDTSAKERARMTDEFNFGSGTDVFLISLKAGGTGLNLTGADTVIHLDPWWNVAAENQATDRAHRIGQTHNVEVIKLIAENSIEQRVVELQNIKKDLIDRIISNDDRSITNTSIEDISFILE